MRDEYGRINMNCPPEHRVNRVENWHEGDHCSGVVQCGTCARKFRYDILFRDDLWSLEKKFFERVGGVWRQVSSADDLVFEFEQED